MNRIEGDLYVKGTLGANRITLPAASIVDASVAAEAAIAASKLQHQHRCLFNQANTTTAAETRVIYVCYGAAGTVVDFRAGTIGACTGDAVIHVDLKKNGASILASTITLDNTVAARATVEATLASVDLVTNDVLEVVVTVAPGSGVLGTGLFAAATIEEDAS